MFKYMKQTFLELKREIHDDKIMSPDYNIPLAEELRHAWSKGPKYMQTSPLNNNRIYHSL